MVIVFGRKWMCRWNTLGIMASSIFVICGTNILLKISLFAWSRARKQFLCWNRNWVAKLYNFLMLVVWNWIYLFQNTNLLLQKWIQWLMEVTIFFTVHLWNLAMHIMIGIHSRIYLVTCIVKLKILPNHCRMMRRVFHLSSWHTWYQYWCHLFPVLHK